MLLVDDWIKWERYNGYCPKIRKSFEIIFAVPAEEMKDVMGMRVVTMKCECHHPIHVTPKQKNSVNKEKQNERPHASPRDQVPCFEVDLILLKQRVCPPSFL